ncbi:MAG: EamA family transporter [Acidobacteriota bacterium]|nr:EamA family transporter [Acidobacteriota bacterium]
MELVAYALVLLSAFTHAYWNFILKRSGGTHVFIGLSKVVEAVLFLIPFIYFITKDEIAILNYWLFYVIGALLVLLNYVFLGQAYNSGGDLSLVYPISRAGMLLFLLPLAYLIIGKEIDSVGFIAILLIIAGLVCVQLPAFNFKEFAAVVLTLKSSAALLALLAALTAACYTLWDKYSIKYLTPFIYICAYTSLIAVSYALFIFIKYPFEAIKNEWTNLRHSIVQVGFFNTFTYLLVLYSLQTGKASYVIALRQLSIVFGVILGWKLLREDLTFPKKIGTFILLAGCLLISLAH